MAMNEANGWKERMDRVERGIEHLLEAAAKHDALLASLAQRDAEARERLDRHERAISKLVELQIRSDENVNRALDIVVAVAEAQKHTDQRLNSLIAVVDDLVRRDRGSIN